MLDGIIQLEPLSNPIEKILLYCYINLKNILLPLLKTMPYSPNN